MCTYIVYMILNLNKKSCCLKVLNHRLTCLITVHSGIFATIFINSSIIIEHINLREIVSLANLEIVRVMCRCNLNNTCTKFHIYVFICNNRNLAVHKRQFNHLSDKVFVSVIIRIYCKRRVTDKCLRTCSCDDDGIICSYDWILDMPEMSCLLLIFNLSI